MLENQPQAGPCQIQTYIMAILLGNLLHKGVSDKSFEIIMIAVSKWLVHKITAIRM